MGASVGGGCVVAVAGGVVGGTEVSLGGAVVTGGGEVSVGKSGMVVVALGGTVRGGILGTQRRCPA